MGFGKIMKLLILLLFSSHGLPVNVSSFVKRDLIGQNRLGNNRINHSLAAPEELPSHVFKIGEELVKNWRRRKALKAYWKTVARSTRPAKTGNRRFSMYNRFHKKFK